jgi:hypothetical protein
MKNKSELEESLMRLDESARKIIKTRGYTREVEKIKMLEELIKEQLRNEDTRRSTSAPR